jgi:hypothetical protein
MYHTSISYHLICEQHRGIIEFYPPLKDIPLRLIPPPANAVSVNWRALCPPLPLPLNSSSLISSTSASRGGATGSPKFASDQQERLRALVKVFLSTLYLHTRPGTHQGHDGGGPHGHAGAPPRALCPRLERAWRLLEHSAGTMSRDGARAEMPRVVHTHWIDLRFFSQRNQTHLFQSDRRE